MSQTVGSGLSSLSPPDLSGSEVPVAESGDRLDTSAPGYRAKVQHAAEQFESFFIEEILQQMRRSMRDIDPDEAQGAKRGEDDMTDLGDTMLADSLSHRHAFGVADAILRQLVPVRSENMVTNPQAAALKSAAAPVALSKQAVLVVHSKATRTP